MSKSDGFILLTSEVQFSGSRISNSTQSYFTSDHSSLGSGNWGFDQLPPKSFFDANLSCRCIRESNVMERKDYCYRSAFESRMRVIEYPRGGVKHERPDDPVQPEDLYRRGSLWTYRHLSWASAEPCAGEALGPRRWSSSGSGGYGAKMVLYARGCDGPHESLRPLWALIAGQIPYACFWHVPTFSSLEPPELVDCGGAVTALCSVGTSATMTPGKASVERTFQEMELSADSVRHSCFSCCYLFPAWGECDGLWRSGERRSANWPAWRLSRNRRPASQRQKTDPHRR